MIKHLVSLLLLLVSLPAFADYAASPTAYSQGTTYRTTPEGICNHDRIYGVSNVYGNGTTTVEGAWPAVVKCKMTAIPDGTVSFFVIDVTIGCPFGGTLNNTTKMCVGGDGPPPPCIAGPGPNVNIVTAYYTGNQDGAAIAKKVVPDGGSKGVPTCMGGCSLVTTGVLSCQSDTTPSKFVKTTCTFTTDKTGGTCTAGPGTGPDESPPVADGNTGSGKCPVGQSPSGQDSSGHTTCKADAPPSTTPPKVSESKPPVTTTNPDGSSTTKTETSETNSDGSTTTTTKTTTTKSDGTSTTTVTMDTKKADGTAGGKPDKPDSDLCKQNPNLTVCKNSQVLGSCGEITCEGDAIQCATLRAAAAMQCRQADDKKVLEESSAYGLGKQVASGTDPMGSDLPGPGKAALVTMPSSLDSSGWLGGGALPADKSFTLQGRTVVIPFAKWLAYLVVLRYALMVVALLVSFKILSGAIIRE